VDIFGIFQFLGGIALFLFGMRLMGDALSRQATGRFKSVLENLTSNPLKGVVLGTGVTAVIQSSAATAVMVLGFVNSGIMSLETSISLIMGANIGTTATGWILSLNGVRGTTFLLRLLNPDSFVPIFAFVGAFLLLFTHGDRKKDIGYIFLGFAVLMYGMNVMSDALSPLTDSQAFADILTFFSHPVMGVLIGFIISAATQSSSASIGILQAVSATGSIPFATALPIIMGINIGACLVVLLSAVGSTRDGKRSAVIGILYNFLGTVICLTLYTILDRIFDFPLSDRTVDYVIVAATHTLFKVAITAILLPFSKQLIALSKLFVPEVEAESRFQLLDDHFLNTPPVAVARCRELTEKMARLSVDTLFRAMALTKSFDESQIKEIQEAESEVDQYEDKLGTYMVKLSGRTMTAGDSREVSRLLHCIGDFERISDHAVNIMRNAEELHQKNISFSREAREDLDVVYSAVLEIVDLAVEAFETNDPAVAAKVEPLEQVVDQLKAQLKARHIARLQRGECTTILGFVFSDLITNYERVADHCSNIAVCVIQLSQNSFDTHTYLNKLKNSDNDAFEALYSEYLNKYSLVK